MSIAGIAQADPNAGHGKADVPMMDAKFPTMSAKYGMGVTPFNLVFLEILEIVVEENSTRTLVPVKIDFAFDRV